MRACSKSGEVGTRLHVWPGTIGLIISLFVAIALFDFSAGGSVFAASNTCPVPAFNYGKETLVADVKITGTYRVWSHMLVPDPKANTYMLQVDASHCFMVGGGSSLKANTWTWVSYTNGNPALTVQLSNLTAGPHKLTLTGTAAGVSLDEILLTSDVRCVPTGSGGNCNSNATVTTPVAQGGNGSPTGSDSTSSNHKRMERYLIAALSAIVAVLIAVLIWFRRHKGGGAYDGF